MMNEHKSLWNVMIKYKGGAHSQKVMIKIERGCSILYKSDQGLTQKAESLLCHKKLVRQLLSLEVES